MARSRKVIGKLRTRFDYSNAHPPVKGLRFFPLCFFGSLYVWGEVGSGGGTQHALFAVAGYWSVSCLLRAAVVALGVLIIHSQELHNKSDMFFRVALMEHI